MNIETLEVAGIESALHAMRNPFDSWEVCKAFRALGNEAYSCDILECSGGHPEWHIKSNGRTMGVTGWMI